MTRKLASACRRLVAATAVVMEVGGILDVGRGGETGFIVPPGDVAALADRIHFLLEDPSLAAKIRAASRDRILGRFTLGGMVADYWDAYRQAARCSAG